MLTRAEHLQWCKDRALAYVEQGQLQDAFASMASDLRQHPETETHKAIEIGMLLLLSGHLSTQDAMRRFIQGFH